MKLSVEEGYRMWQGDTPENSILDGIAGCIFEDYSADVSGYAQREYLRAKRPSIYEELARVKSLDDFAAIVARYKLEMEE
jgi:hypothetical protein